MKFRNLILAVLLAGTIIPQANAMELELNDAQAETEIVPWPPQDVWCRIFILCGPSENQDEVFNLMYTCKDWYNVIINPANGKFNDNVAAFFLHTLGESCAFNGNDPRVNSPAGRSEILLQTWILEKCGISYGPLHTSMDEIGELGNWGIGSRVKMFISLAKKSFDPNAQNTQTGDTLLHCVDDGYNIVLIKILLAFGANPLICNNHNMPACAKSLAVSQRDHLLDYVTHDPIGNNKTSTDKTLLHLISGINSGDQFFAEKSKKLLRLHININPQDNQGNTPLHDFIQYNFVGDGSSYRNGSWGVTLKEALASLVKLGANPTIANNAGETPLDLARRLHDEPTDQEKLDDTVALEIIDMLEHAAEYHSYSMELLEQAAAERAHVEENYEDVV